MEKQAKFILKREGFLEKSQKYLKQRGTTA